MRLERDYFGAVKNFFGWFISRFKPLAVHTELIVDDDCWKVIQEKVRDNKVKIWHIMTPANYDYYKNSFNIKYSKGKISEIMKKRYLWLIQNNQKIGLHIHLSLTMKNMTYEEQEKLFKEGLGWMKEKLGIVPVEFVPGWWSFNKDTLKICEKYGLKMIYERDYDYTHDYHWVL